MTSVMAAQVQQLGQQLWEWRARQQPRSSDDIARVERPAEWAPQWSPANVEDYRRHRARLVAEWTSLDVSGEPIPVQVDYRLIGSALARVRWELDVLRSWERDATFYVDQSLGTVFDVLVEQPPLGERRSRDLLAVLHAIPETLECAVQNLRGTAAAPFAHVAIDNLAGAGAQLQTAMAALPDDLPRRAEVLAAAAPAAAAIDGYRGWLQEQLPAMDQTAFVGRDGYAFFLRHVALLPLTPEQMLAMGRQEWQRSAALEALIRHRYRARSAVPVFGSAGDQVAAQRAAELEVRDFYEQQELLSQPPTLAHYRTMAIPPYLAPLAWLGVADDLTSPSRLDCDGVSYIPQPAEDLPYFELANARDPRAGIVHEGAHYQQLARSFASANPLRRHFYDSTPNEGIAFYNEELLLHAGLFDDRWDTQVAIYSFLRLRALRVEVDVRLALGEITIEEAAAQLEQRVPMDRSTARQEAAFFAANPGQAPSYQIGKLQILRLLADAVALQGVDFSPRRFHDALWDNGNVPLSLFRWELLGLRDDVDALGAPEA